jgi:hypothetical protein
VSGRHGPPGRDDGRAPRLDPIPKPGGGVRWLTRLDPAGERAFRRAVAPIAGRIESSLGPEVLASRITSTPGGWRVAPWRPYRSAWHSALRGAVARGSRGTVFAVTDVRDCYGSITAETVEALLGPEAARAVRVLRELRELGVRGLPVGPEPSAVLANGVLARLDATLRRSGVRHLRWVDDLVLWGAEREVRRALDALRRTAATVGLELQERKTVVAAAPDEARGLLLGRRPSGAAEGRAGIIAAP